MKSREGLWTVVIIVVLIAWGQSCLADVRRDALSAL